MATNRWRGDAIATAKVITLEVGSSTAGHTFVTTINGKSITYTAGSGETTDTIAAAIQLLLDASTIPEFAEIVWTVDADTITGTAATPGVPFTVSESGTGTYTLTTVTASSGPNDASLAANWSLGAVPGAGDDVLVDGGADLLYFDGLSGADYNSLRIKASFAGKIGLPLLNDSGYIEYRARAWPVNSAVPVTVGEGDGTGPVRCNLSCGTAIDLTVHATGTRDGTAAPAVNAYGCSSGTVNVLTGDVGLAADDDTTSATVTTATVNNGATLTVGKGATVTTAEQKGATVLAYGTVTTLNTIDGETTLYSAPTTITADGGTVYLRHTGTVTTVTARGQGQTPPRIDCALDSRARTFTNHSFTGGAVLNDPDKTVTFTNSGTWDRQSLAASDLGARLTLTRS